MSKAKEIFELLEKDGPVTGVNFIHRLPILVLDRFSIAIFADLDIMVDGRNLEYPSAAGVYALFNLQGERVVAFGEEANAVVLGVGAALIRIGKGLSESGDTIVIKKHGGPLFAL